MSGSLRHVSPQTIIVGYDFSTGAVKGLAFDLQGQVLAEARFPTDLWTEDGVSELNLLQLEGQARAVTRALAHRLGEMERLDDWQACGISATHHTAGRIDRDHNPVRRAICWNDQTLATYHAQGLERLGGPQVVQELIGGPWAERYTLSHLVKDESTLSEADWARTSLILPHGPLAAGYLTGRFDVTSVSSAASTGMMDLRTNQWRLEMLGALKDANHRQQVERCLPMILEHNEPIWFMGRFVAMEAGIDLEKRPQVFPTLDDQAAGLVGGGAVDAGQVAIILGNSAVVNSSAQTAPRSSQLDAMKLNWGPYLWMRCYSNGAQFLDRIVGRNPDWAMLEIAARQAPPGCDGVTVSPFILSEPSLGVKEPSFGWHPSEPGDAGVRVRASFEALAYLIALGVREHEAAGQTITRVTVSGGIARSELMCEILASVLDRPLERLVSSEGPALGAAVATLSGLESFLRKQNQDDEPFTVAEAVETMVRFRAPTQPRPEWIAPYQQGLARFEQMLPR